MITKFKIYDSINQGEPEKGDYVIVNQNDDDHYFDDDTTNSLNNNIHRLINIIYNSNSTSYVIDFSISWLVNRDEKSIT